MHARAALLGLLGLVAAAPALAQDDCILDNCADKRPPVSGGSNNDRPHRFGRDGAGPRGASRLERFAFYVRARSWGPGFCGVGGGDEKGRDQCRRGTGTGFTVHGLWPQYDRGFPSDCRGNTNPPRAALAATDGVYPDQGLARYEWRKHGTCSGLSPSDYFAAAKGARDAVIVPERFKDPHGDQHLAPVDVVRALTDANPRLRPGMLAAVCRSGTLEEVRICFSKDLKSFQACPEGARGECRGGDMDVPPVR